MKKLQNFKPLYNKRSDCLIVLNETNVIDTSGLFRDFHKDLDLTKRCVGGQKMVKSRR